MAATDDARVVQQLADRVVREADRLSRIVDDLLDLSQIEAQEAPSRAPIPVRLLVSETVDLVQAAADLAEVPIRRHAEPPEIEIACDRRQMRSALMNLLDNAIKYSGPRQPVEVGAEIVGDRLALIVRDHGIGIPTRDLERIFERFYRVDRAQSRDRRHRPRSRDRSPRRAGARRRRHRRVARRRGLDVHAPGADLERRRAPGLGGLVMADPPLILVVDDEQSYRDALSIALQREGSSSRPRPTVPRRSRFDATRPRSCSST